jgi:hypothetical protein
METFPYDAPVPPASVGVDAEQHAVRRRGRLVASIAVGVARGARREEGGGWCRRERGQDVVNAALAPAK